MKDSIFDLLIPVVCLILIVALLLLILDKSSVPRAELKKYDEIIEFEGEAYRITGECYGDECPKTIKEGKAGLPSMKVITDEEREKNPAPVNLDPNKQYSIPDEYIYKPKL